ncbi:MAG: peptidase C39 [Clostridium sp.]|nr:peptidase C39 [Clostridium sp.]
MKNLLNYQTSEYDCGPVSILNGIRYLFEREDIYPDLVKFIMLYCMDTYNEAGELCKHGTSPAAMSYMTCWLNHFSERKNFPLRCEHYSGEVVTLAPGSPIWTALEQGGVVVVYLYLEVGHYVLLTGLDGDRVLLFDPFYEELDDPDLDEEYSTDEIHFICDQPKKCNRSVAIDRINRTSKDYYEMGEISRREALVMYHS